MEDPNDSSEHAPRPLRPTPVTGNGPALRGASGYLRRAAYGIPEHRPSHSLLLLIADRTDVVESAVRAHKWWLLPLVPVGLLLLRRRLARRRR